MKKYLSNKNFISLLITIILITILVPTITLIRQGKLFEPETHIPDKYENVVYPDAQIDSSIDFSQFTLLGNDVKTEQERLVVFDNTDNKTLTLEKDVAENPNSVLTITDQSTNSSQTIEKDNILFAELIGDEEIIYQETGDNAGIYTYNTETKEEKEIIKTNDVYAFGLVEIINENKFFYIKPSTGEMGFDTVDDSFSLVLETKLLPTTNSDIKINSYNFPTLSPNKEFIAVVDLDSNSEFKTNLKIFRTDTSDTNPYYETEITLIPRGLEPYENVIAWSNDSKLLTAGHSGIVIDIDSKNILIEENTDDRYLSVNFSPDSTKYIQKSLTTGNSQIFELENNNKFIDLPEFTRQAEWLDNERVILTIGNKLYIQHISTNSLTLAAEEIGEFLIEVTNNGNAIVTSENGVFSIN